MPEPDGPQFQHLWDIAMSDANDTLDAVSDEDLDEAVAESMISDAIGGMVDASQIEETGHTQAELSPQDREFSRRNQATYDAAEAMERIEPSDLGFTVHPQSPEEFEAESHDEYRIRLFHRGTYQAGADYFTDDWDEVQEMVSDPSNWGGGGTVHNLLPDPTTDFAISEQADYNQHLEDTGGELPDLIPANRRRPFGPAVTVGFDWSGGGQGPDYAEPDPFDRSDPEQNRQAKAIEAMNKVWE